MTFEETRSILKIVKAEWGQSFRGMSKEDAEAKLNLWAEMFAEDSVNLVGAAVKAIIVAGNREFAPSVGQVKEQMRKIQESRGSGYTWQALIDAGKVQESELGSVSRYARLHGVSWEEARQLALSGTAISGYLTEG